MTYRHDASSRQRRTDRSAATLARGLGWFSIALGAAELVAPHRLARILGLEGREGLVRAYGAREIATGIGILSAHDPTAWIWGRVGGDGLDLATLAAALGRDNPQRGHAGLSLAAVAGVTVLDLICAQMLKRAAQSRTPMRDYRDRRGLPRSPEVMRGIARDFEVPRDMRTPEAMRPYRSAGGEGPRPHRSGAAPAAAMALNKGFGVQVTIPGADGGKRRVQPLVVVARNERDAELVAAAAGGDRADARILRELTPDEVRNYGLDLAVYGDTRALPALNL